MKKKTAHGLWLALCLWASSLTLAQSIDSIASIHTHIIQHAPSSIAISVPDGLLLANWSIQNSLISHVNTAGETQWSQSYPNLRAVSATNEQAALVSEATNGQLSVSVISLTNNGKLIWQTDVGPGTQADVAQFADGRIAVVTRTDKGLSLYNLSASGKSGWGDDTSQPDPEVNGPLGLLTLPDSGLVLTVGSNVIGIDKVGHKRWSFDAGNDKVRWNQMRLLQNGDVVLVGQGTSAAFSPDNVEGRLMVISPKNGKQHWTKILSDTNTKEAGIDVLEKPDHTLLVLLQESAGASLLQLNAQHEIRAVGRFSQPNQGKSHYLALMPLSSERYGVIYTSASQTVLQEWQAKNSKSATRSEPEPLLGMSRENKTNVYGLSIGVSLPSLEFMASDASAVSDAFGQQSGKAFDKVSFQVLNTPERSTAEQMAIAVERWRNTLNPKPDDWIILFVSGMLTDYQNDLRLVGSDYDRVAPRSSTVGLRQLLRELNVLPCRKLILLDACMAYAPKPEKNNPRLSTHKAFSFSSKQFPNTYILAACRPGELAYEDAAWQHGAFTKALLDGLNGAADTDKNNQLYLSELYAYLSETVPTLVRTQKQREQQPTWLLRPGDELLLKK
ncbi:outer membrane protein assembly factor BamB family protein [Spirosoma litoris]